MAALVSVLVLAEADDAAGPYYRLFTADLGQECEQFVSLDTAGPGTRSSTSSIG
ncbi:hypothetical protein [Pseudarthrobacter sp. NamB4]|uniref:hypothetical protein n=1 Tax=Pseudarthrobacter sp. NamB4 TaxID=2576837 RepID=UPI00148549DD|nr:hypothetical protein [Pseudarthrobacter sp. NamB4]